MSNSIKVRKRAKIHTLYPLKQEPKYINYVDDDIIQLGANKAFAEMMNKAIIERAAEHALERANQAVEEYNKTHTQAQRRKVKLRTKK